MKVPISDILVKYGDNNSRPDLKPSDCEDLASNIETQGLDNPVAVREITGDHKYKLVRGYRRMMSCSEILGWEEIEVYVDPNTTEENEGEKNLIENLVRKDMTYWQECCGLRRTYPGDMGDTEISRRVGKSKAWVRNRWAMWKLPDEVLDQIEVGLLSAADVNLLIVKSPDEQLAAAAAIVAGKAAGQTTSALSSIVGGRKAMRSRKEIQKMMTYMLEGDRENEMHSLRYAIGEISDTQLIELLS